MGKFFILVIFADLKLQRTWADNNIVTSILKENAGSKVYRASNDQEAVLVDDKVLWLDVPTVDKVN